MAKSETAWRFLAATLFCAIIIYFSGLTNANAEECANLMSSESRPPDAAYAWLQKISPLIDLVRQEQDADAARKLRPYLSDTAQQSMSETVLENRTERVEQHKDSVIGVTYSIDVGQQYVLKAGTSIILQAGLSQLVLDKDGTITLTGQRINAVGKSQVVVQSDIIKMN